MVHPYNVRELCNKREILLIGTTRMNLKNIMLSERRHEMLEKLKLIYSNKKLICGFVRYRGNAKGQRAFWGDVNVFCLHHGDSYKYVHLSRFHLTVHLEDTFYHPCLFGFSGLNPETSCILSTHTTTELHPQPPKMHFIK